MPRRTQIRRWWWGQEKMGAMTMTMTMTIPLRRWWGEDQPTNTRARRRDSSNQSWERSVTKQETNAKEEDSNQEMVVVPTKDGCDDDDDDTTNKVVGGRGSANKHTSKKGLM